MLEDVLYGRAKTVDRVMLNLKNLRTKWPIEKLEHKMLIPLVVLCKIGSWAYEIALPDSWEIYPVCQVRLLELYQEDPKGIPQKEIPTPKIVDNEPIYLVFQIVESVVWES